MNRPGRYALLSAGRSPGVRLAVAAVGVGLAVTGCSASESGGEGAAPKSGTEKGTAAASQDAPPAPVRFDSNVDAKAEVAVDKVV